MRELIAPLYRRSLPYLGRLTSALKLKRPTILCLHSIERHDDPNRMNGKMAVTDIFLDRLIGHMRHRNIEIISLDECIQRISENDLSPFLCLTFDDGYRDNYEIAYPVLNKHNTPATIFLATGLLDRTSPMWWHPLERALSISDEFGRKANREALKTEADRQRVYEKWARSFRALDLSGRLKLVHELAEFNAHFQISDAFESALEWGMVRKMAASGLITFGAHTATHPVMADLTETDLLAEVIVSRDRCEEMTGRYTKYFAYPFGQAHETGLIAPKIVEKAGFSAAFTTKATTIGAGNGKDYFHLPRIMLTQQTQNISSVDAYVSGLTEFLKGI